jgi:hypothetical protein
MLGLSVADLGVPQGAGAGEATGRWTRDTGSLRGGSQVNGRVACAERAFRVSGSWFASSSPIAHSGRP